MWRRLGTAFLFIVLVSVRQAAALELSGFAPATAAVGEAITLEGNGFAGVTAVTFNGNASTFRIISDQKLVAMVPMGSVEGPIGIWKEGEFASVPRSFALETPTSTVIGWGGQNFQFGKNQTVAPADLTNAIAIAAGSTFSLAIKRDKQLVVWGQFSNLPPILATNKFLAVAAESGLVLGLDSTGRLFSHHWDLGDFAYQPFPLAATNIIAVTSGLALRRDGKVFTLLTQNYSIGPIQEPMDIPPAIAIAGSFESGTALHPNGQCTAWSTLTAERSILPLNKIVAISQMGNQQLLLTQAGELFVWNSLARSLKRLDTNVTMTAGYWDYALSLKQDGAISIYGYGNWGQTNVPPYLSDVAALSCNMSHCLALARLRPKITLQPEDTDGVQGARLKLAARVVGDKPLFFEWFHNGAWMPGETNAALSLENLQNDAEGEYRLLAWNQRGVVLSEAALVKMIDDFVAFGFSRPQLPGFKVTIFGRGLNHATAVTFNGNAAVFRALDENRLEAIVPHGIVTGQLRVWINGSFREVPETYSAPSDPQVLIAWRFAAAGGFVPPTPTNLDSLVAVSAGHYHTLGLRADGTVAAWGGGAPGAPITENYGQAQVPASATNIIAISAGDYHSLALKADGTVLSWGGYNGTPPPPPHDLRRVTAISAGGSYNLALLEDGTVRGWGDNSENAAEPPPGLRNVVQVVAMDCSIAIKADGSAVIWGGRYTVPKTIRLASPIVQASSRFVNIFLSENGSTVLDYPGERSPNVPAAPNVALKAVALSDFDKGLGIRLDGTLFAWPRPEVTLGGMTLISDVTALTAGPIHAAVLVRAAPLAVQPPGSAPLQLRELALGSIPGQMRFNLSRVNGTAPIVLARIRICSSTNIAGPWTLLEGALTPNVGGFNFEYPGFDRHPATFFRVLETLE